LAEVGFVIADGCQSFDFGLLLRHELKKVLLLLDALQKDFFLLTWQIKHE